MNILKVKKFFMDYFRPRRLRQFREMFPDIMTTINILDVGGTSYQWDYLKSPASITILNSDARIAASSGAERYTYVVGDGRRLPYNDSYFDLVFSNSVIEHVGSLDDQARFAVETRRVGKQIYCQTPNKWFFIEPHLVAPFIHWLPVGIQKRLVRWCSVWGWATKPNQQRVVEFLSTTRLLTYRELTRLFPDCEILRERFLGMTKSFIVVRKHS